MYNNSLRVRHHLLLDLQLDHQLDQQLEDINHRIKVEQGDKVQMQSKPSEMSFGSMFTRYLKPLVANTIDHRV